MHNSESKGFLGSQSSHFLIRHGRIETGQNELVFELMNFG